MQHRGVDDNGVSDLENHQFRALSLLDLSTGSDSVWNNGAGQGHRW